MALDGAFAGIHLEFHTGDESPILAWSGVASEPGAPERDQVVGLGTVTLVGDLDRTLFQHLREFLVDDLGAIEHDETDGFTA